MRVLLTIIAFLFISFSSSSQVFTGTGGTIPGTSTTQTCFTRNVTGVGVINGTYGLASVCITITHPNVDELEIVLTAPDGTVVPLSIQNGGTGNNYTNTCFTATATTPIKFGTAPFNGSYLPEGYLGAVNNGQNANGAWRICIQDRRTGANAGVLNSWSLTFNNTPAPVPPARPTCANNLPTNSSCATAALVCDFNGQCGTTSGSTVQDWTGSGLDGCFGLQNNSFIRFIAAATTASFSVWVPTTTQANYNQGGIQMLFFSGTCNSGPVTTYGCYPHILPYSGSGQPLITVVTASGLTPGNTYYLMIDGFNNDNNTFTIAANTGVNVLNVTPPAPAICAGSSVNLTATGGNGIYSWTPNTNLNTTSGATVTASPTGTITYTVSSTTATGCPLTKDVTVTVNPLPAAPAATVTQPTCTTPTGTITVTAPLGAGLTYSINGGPYQPSPVFTGLAPGATYTVTVQNAASCLANTPFTINAAPPTPAAPTGTITQPTCTVPTGTITIAAPTGAGLQYSINGGPYQPSPVFSGLTPGSYTLTVQNAAGCTSPASTPFVLNAAPNTPAAPTGTVTQGTCTTPTGTITITAPVGAGLTYSINGGPYQPSPVFPGLAPGPYTITVQNAAGCTSPVSAPFLVTTLPIVATPVATVTQPTCTVPTGTITFTAPVGALYVYRIIPGNITPQASPVFPNLTPGNYVIVAGLAAGPADCFSTSNVTVNAVPVAPAAPTGTITQPTCTTPTGTITITTPTGAGLQYSINGGPYQASPVFTGLTPASYTITVQDAGGCTSPASLPFVVNAAPATQAGPVTVGVVQPNCAIPTGIINIAPPPAGTTPLQFSIDGGVTWSNFSTFVSLAPGNYSIIIRNTVTGCLSVPVSVTINPPPGATATPVGTAAQPTCTVSTGTITITSPAGAGLTYSINGGPYQSSPVFTGLAPGSYTITAQTASTCPSPASTTFVINAGGTPAPFVVNTQNCLTPPNNPSAGQITFVSPTGAAYEYSIDGGITYQSSPVFNNVPWNTYTITYRVIATGCVAAVQTVTLAGIPGPGTFTITQPITCNGGGTVTVTSPLGNQYSYELLVPNGNPGSIPWQASPVFNNVPPGNYTLVIGMGQCLLPVNNPIVITAPNAQAGPLNITTVHPNCGETTGRIILTPPAGTNLEFSINGTTYQSSATFNNVPPGTYNITVRNTVTGCVSAPTSTTVLAPPTLPGSPAGTVTQPSCGNTRGSITITSPVGANYEYSINGGAYQSSPLFDNLNPASYTIVVRNTVSGCISNAQSFTLNNAPAPPAMPTLATLQPNCTRPAGSISVLGPLGADLEYNINNGPYQASPNFTGLAQGTYIIKIRNKVTGCESQTSNSTINQPQLQPTKPVITQTQPSCPARVGEIRVDAPVGPDVEYSINGTSYQTSNIFPNLAGGNYTVTARFIGSTCVSEGTAVQIFGLTPEQCLQPANGDIYFPSAFTPNGDGRNDGFGPGPKTNLANVTGYTLMVFNRYGEKVFETNDPLAQWNGTYKGKMLANYSYTWVAKYRYGTRAVQVQKGSVTVIR